MIATRDAYGKKLAELGKTNPNIVVMDADLSCSTKTGVFAKEFPERFINAGVAEQDLMGMAAGLASCGKTVYCSTFAIFATGRAWEPVRQSIAYPKMNVKICASHAGLTVGEDGASHQILEDIALMRAIPNMKVYVPSDGIETASIIEAISKDNGPAYVRLGRAKCPLIFDESYQFESGKASLLKKGKDVCIFTAGFMTSICLEAAQDLENKGISASVVNMSSIKPIDEDMIVKMAQEHAQLFSVEEHSVMGGLGSAIAEVLVEKNPAPLKKLGVQDVFGQSGSYQDVLKHYQLDAQGIAEQIAKVSST